MACGTNPFALVAARLASVQDSTQIDDDDIVQITEPLIGFGSPDDLMSHAKTASNYLYVDMEPNERLNKITDLLSTLRAALDYETSNHADLTANANELRQNREPQTKSLSDSKGNRPDAQLEAKITKCAFLLGQSEERVQALSGIMLYLCSAMQYAQGSVNS